MKNVLFEWKNIKLLHDFVCGGGGGGKNGNYAVDLYAVTFLVA